jgi:hypothetical protein
MDEEGVAPALRDALLEALYGTADWMRNRPDGAREARDA